MASQSRVHEQIENVLTYEYEPLAEDNSEIRVLIILPGQPADAIHIELLPIAFNVEDADIPPYEALSYTWGSPDNPILIFIECPDGSRSLAVSQNCHDALRNLRYLDETRLVWIDAICIDQTDLNERARQVSIMRSIYSEAEQVFVWLGPCANDSDRAIEWINSIDLRFAYDKRNLQVVSVDATSTQLAVTDTELEAFTALLERPYFDRLWVWQEVRTGGDATTVRCGDVGTTFQALMTAVQYCIQNVSNATPTAMRLIPRLQYINRLPLKTRFEALTALDRLRECQFTDQRDRVYTASAFGDFNRNMQMTPDYKRSTKNVYIDLILRYLDVRGQNLSFLRYVGNCVLPDGPAETADMPSWTPDWSQRNLATPLGFSFCGSSSIASILSVDRVQLTVQGIRAGTVHKSAMFGYETLAESIYLNTCRVLQSLVPSDTNDAFLHRLARVITSNLVAEHYSPSPQGYATIVQCRRYLRQVLGERNLSSLAPDYTIHRDQELLMVQRRLHFCQGRSLFTTRDGEIGLGPQDMREGDILTILLGCREAMVLRPTDANQDCYRVIGNALCTDIMDAEPLLGQFPKDWESVQVINKPYSDYIPAFRHKSDGSITYQDPRLPPLSAEWETLSEEESRKCFSVCPLAYRNKFTEEVRHYLRDPRMTVDALTERGIQIEAFKLV